MINNLNKFNYAVLQTKIKNANNYFDQLLIDDLGNDMFDNGIIIYDKLTKPVITFLKNQDNFQDANKNIVNILDKMITDNLELQLTNKNNIGDIIGHVSVNYENNKQMDSLNNSILRRILMKELSESDYVNALKLCFDKAPDEAVEYLESRGIAVTWEWKEQLEKIKAHAFTVAKTSNADIVQMFKNELDTAVQKGITYQEFKKKTENILIDKGYSKREDGAAWRLDTIYRMNLQTGYMSGRYFQQIEAVKEFPLWEFIAVLDNRTTEGCLDLNGVILPSDNPFWSINYVPRHYMCRSRVRSTNNKLMERRGQKESNSKDYEDVKPAEGFDTNPAETWRPDLTKYSDDVKKWLKAQLGEK